VIDTSRVWPAVWRAVSCHKTQMAIHKKLEELSNEHQRSLWGTQEFYRVFSASMAVARRNQICSRGCDEHCAGDRSAQTAEGAT
jgi:hypothetical protein